MNQKDYKKTYEGDYTKSYRDQATWARESAQRKQAYDVVSKKLDANPYNKKERSAVYDITGTRPKESERVYAEGAHHEKRTTRPQTQTPPRERKPENRTQTQPTSPPTPRVETRRPAPVAEKPIVEQAPMVEDDGQYNSYIPPIRQIGLNKYLNLKTKEELNVNGARRVLTMAKYKPQGIQNVARLIIIFIVINIWGTSFLGAIVAVGYGAFRLMKSTTTWIRKEGKNTYHFTLPVSEDEMADNKRIAMMAFGVGAITLIISLSSLLFSSGS